MTQEERELIWLSKKVAHDEDLVNRADAYFRQHQRDWERGVYESFFDMLEKMKDQLYFEQSRLERLAWKIHDERERDAGRDPAFDERLLRRRNP